MKASIEWLQEYSDIDIQTEELADKLTMSGSIVEKIESRGKEIKNVVVGKILEINKHPDADKLVVTKVDIGKEKLQIVTGADNIKVNDIVPIAKDGSTLPGGVTIKTGKLRGVDSCGMMCSIGELGLTLEEYPDQIEDGIMILSKEFEKHLGENIVPLLALDEEVLDFEITPNRPDCLSVEGLGREVAATINKEFKNPRSNIDNLKIEDKKEIQGLSVEIKDPDLCYRYIARVVENVKIGPSPKWLVRRLNACGVRSINNIVDITNYVMLEMGQPMHAFDINSIEGKHITVRRAKDGEKITTLDEIERELNNTNLVIADTKKPVAIAGVMGGINSGIEENTKTVVFESAVFNRGSVRLTAKQVGLRTEASSRYEKGLSPENALRAVNRAVELVEILKAGNQVDGKIDVYPTKQEQKQVPLNVEKINKLIGINLSKNEMIKILERLEMKIENDIVYPPYFRMDIEQVEDLAEEVARFYGYGKLEPTLMKSETTIGLKTKEQKIQDKIRNVLLNNGVCEIYTYGFISKKDLDKINLPKDHELRAQTILLKNPLSEDYQIMRATTIPSMLQMLANNNDKKNEEVRLYDLSRNYRDINNQIEKGEIPLEETILTIGMYGENEDFYTIKGLVENILEAVSVDRYTVEKETKNTSYHPGRTANCKLGNDIIATIGEIHPTVLHNYGIEKRAYLAEINVTKLVKYSRENKKYTEIPKFPASQRDLAIVVDEKIEVSQIERILVRKGKKLLENIKLFDIYRNDKLGQNKKSIAYRLTFRDKKKTLKEEEINEIMEQIIAQLEKELKAEIRK